MNYSAAIIGIVAALAAVLVFLMFGTEEAQTPIVDAKCSAGYVLVGEGCMPAKDACELGGDQYYFDEATEECRMR